MSALKWLWGYLKEYKAGLIAVVLVTLVFIAGAFIIPIIMGLFVDDVIVNGKKSLMFFYAFLLIGSVIIKEGVHYWRMAKIERISQSVVKAIRNKLYSKLQSLDCSFFDHTRTGDLMSRLTMDTDAIRVVIAGTFVNLLNQILFIVVGIAIICSINLVIGLSLFLVAPFIGFFAFCLAKRIKYDFLAMRESNAELNTVVQENISGNRVVKAYAREEYEIEKFEEKNQKYSDAFMGHVHTWKKYYPSMYFFVKLLSVLFLLSGGYLVMKNIITVGEFTTINGCLWSIQSPMTNIGNIINQFQQFNASSLKIRGLEDEIPDIQNREIKKRDTGINGKICFKNVTFAYDGDRVLKNINFTANPGDTIAIIGPTGSGKSTIINLLARFYDPTCGAVYIDDINVKNIDLSTLRQNVASAMQDVFLFSDTVKDNIAYGAPNATLDDVIRVAKIADAHDFIMKLSDGYDTVIGERGTGLSGGQRQRISLARALLKNPAILILDDTTSALDMETEFSIQENLKEGNKTKIIIAHRISSVRNADLILVLNQGSLVEWGTHDSLMELGGYYKGVFEHQFGDFNNGPKYHIEHPAFADMMNVGGEDNGSK
ncbi:MAG: ABC transporter ATP-binding protein [Clostridia bacterium]|nr:ABC transporter ATP-binding protein [Clostridia bacterium]